MKRHRIFATLKNLFQAVCPSFRSGCTQKNTWDDDGQYLPCDSFVIRFIWMGLWAKWKCSKFKDFLARKVFALIPFPQSLRSTKSSVPSKSSLPSACAFLKQGAVGAQPLSQSVHSNICFSRSGPDLARQVWDVDSCGFQMFCQNSRPAWSLDF